MSESMGRVKNDAIKSLGKELIALHGGKFSDNFDTNKKVLAEVKPIKSTKVRNVVAGYITRQMKIIKKRGL